MKEKETLTNNEIFELNTGFLGTQPRGDGGVSLTGLMQYFDQSKDGSITLKLMRISDAIEPVIKAHTKLAKEKIEGEKMDERVKRFESFGESPSGVEIKESDKIKYSELNNLKHPSDVTLNFSPMLIKLLRPIIIFDKK